MHKSPGNGEKLRGILRGINPKLEYRNSKEFLNNRNKDSNIEDLKQLSRASASVGANYIEANESLGKKDFLMHVKISRKESKESRFFLKLIDIPEAGEDERKFLIKESTELMNIFGAIYRKSENNNSLI